MFLFPTDRTDFFCIVHCLFVFFLSHIFADLGGLMGLFATNTRMLSLYLVGMNTKPPNRFSTHKISHPNTQLLKYLNTQLLNY